MQRFVLRGEPGAVVALRVLLITITLAALFEAVAELAHGRRVAELSLLSALLVAWLGLELAPRASRGLTLATAGALSVAVLCALPNRAAGELSAFVLATSGVARIPPGRWGYVVAPAWALVVGLRTDAAAGPAVALNLAIDLALAGLVAALITRLVVANRTLEALRRLAVEHAAAQARAEVAQRIHDTAAQHLAIALRRLDALGPRSELLSVRDEVDGALSALRSVASTELEVNLGEELQRARRRLAEAGIHLRIDADGLGGVAPPQAEHIAWILREATANVVRHADATSVTVRFRANAAAWRLEIIDDGIGLRGAPFGVGLTAVERHAEALGATLSLDSPSRGTRLVIEATQH